LRLIQELTDSILKLDGWIERNGWAGYDPYDIQGHPWLLWALNHKSPLLPSTAASWILQVGADRFPCSARKALRIKKEINAKAMGLFASAYLKLFQSTNNVSYFHKAQRCLNWLEQNRNQGYAGYCWGYPFDWQSVIFIPKGTPSAVVSSICGNAFWDFYKLMGDKRYLNICQRICDFILNNLNISRDEPDRLCFSYTPLDKSHVHNANLLAAEFLIKVARELGNQSWNDYGIKALKYTLDAQNRDGSFYYWALGEKEVYRISENTLKTIDNYHTGFILRSLHSIYKSTQNNLVLKALSNGYEFYRNNLFKDNRIPKLKPDALYPINIHSCAEGILCMSTLSDVFPGASEYAWNVFSWTKQNMQDKDGYFYHLKTNNRVNKMPYIRWGQAWMMRAMSNLLKT
jgi:hypothetical protein